MSLSPFRRSPIAMLASAGTAFLLLASLSPAGARAPAASGPTVATEAGRVRGTASSAVDAWLGIPFAAAPVGALRWRAPLPATPWSGVKPVTAYGHDCMQFPFPSDAAPLGTPPAEDCLYLNVWRPHAAARGLPVIVWIYGGGFLNGGASPPTYSGRNVAGQGVVFVSFNYRLGRFGTFALPQLTAEDPDHGLFGNYGFLDQIAALKWVHRNIAAFGGDPANVTIIGESAGGFSVHALVTSPLATGLFQKAVVMSGGDGGNITLNDRTDLERIGQRFAQSKGIGANDPDALAKLRALPAEALTGTLNMTALFTRGDAPRTFGSPIVDGRIAVNGAQAYKAGSFAHVPMMIGATSDDVGGATGIMIAGARRAAQALSAQDVPVYAYRFSYVANAAETAKTIGAAHATDIPFFFATQDAKYGAQTTPRDRGMGQAISAYVVNFARTGNPNGGGLPQWPRYDAAQDRIMDFGRDGKAAATKDPLGAQIDAAPPLEPLFPRDR